MLRVLGQKMMGREVLNSAIDEEMSADPQVFLMGEEVGEYQGAYKVSKGLLHKYGPQRVVDAPITVSGFTRVGGCAAFYGLKSIVESMTFNFAMQREHQKAKFIATIGKAKPLQGLNAEVINLHSIRPLDRAMINASVRKTKRLVAVEEGIPQHGVGSEISASVIKESFVYLDAPVERIAGAVGPMPYAPNLERMAVPRVEVIVRAAKRACYRSLAMASAA